MSNDVVTPFDVSDDNPEFNRNRVEAFARELHETRDRVERVLSVVERLSEEARQARADDAGIHALIGNLQAHLDKRLDTLAAGVNDLATRVSALERWRDALPPPRITKTRRTTRRKKGS